ncbi:hypothetical protein Cch01nite_37140 [Cellulomonas chitinilytica]|uniref:DUF3806 domain-containing protein n=2 Tax=Cellulomonas chitinilytica TaxID=398759 RepID=A0A919P5B5_9CELL|nr:hypothetical protein Cch01nite_37140 [Cellulomonas chitinilytica]
MRALTPNERHHLDGLRAHVRSSGVDTSAADAVGTFVHRTHASWVAAGGPVPEGLVAALGVALGDLVVARAAGARWMMRTAGSGLTPAVVSLSGAAAVLPLDDIRARWDTGCAPGWGAGYVVAAAAHLTEETGTTSPTVPTPRSSAETAPLPPPAVTTSRPDVTPARSAAPNATPAGPVPTPADLPYPPSPSAQGLALRALGQMLDALAADPSARPFAVVEVGGRADLEEFDDTPAARAWVRASGASCAAVAWVGVLPDDGAPAVLVEACDARRPSLRVAHEYAPARPAGAGRARPARPVGDPIVLGNGAPLL